MEAPVNVDSVMQSFSKVNLTNEEQDEIAVTDSALRNIDVDGRISLLGRLNKNKPYNKAVMLSNMKSQWSGVGWIRFKEILDATFLIQFEQESDKRRVLRGSPWLFSKSLFMLRQVEGNIPRQPIKFDTVEFWVHLYGIPYLGFTEEMGRKIGAKLGTVLMVDTQRKVSWKGGTKGLGYMKVRIMVDIGRTLLRGTFLKYEGGDRQWIQFRYEKLPNFCYGCGRIGHVGKDCMEKDQDPKATEQYGDWMRAGSDAKCPWLGSIYDHDSSAGGATGSSSVGGGYQWCSGRRSI